MELMSVRIEQIGSRWVVRCAYEDRAIPKSAGCRWDPDRKHWYTSDAAIAAKLADPDIANALLAEVRAREEQRAAAVEASRAGSSDVDIPCPEGLAYLPYQRAGIAAALSRTNVLFGDEMGLGKTIQAIGMINADPTLNKILIVCPAGLRLNWKRELEKWRTRKLTIHIVDSKVWRDDYDITIINYDILTKHAAALRATAWDLVVCDEAHYLKNPDAKRTQAVVGKEKKGVAVIEPIKARRRMLLTGTPIPNRPIEGWTLFHYLDPGEFKSFFGYAIRYADASKGPCGWDFSGSANLPELQDKLRGSIMIRRLKADVLTELPAKRRAVIEIPANDAAHAVKAENEAWERQERTMLGLRTEVELSKASADPADYAAAVGKLKTAMQVAFGEMSRVRHATAVAKIPAVIEHLRNAIEDGSKVIVFAHHHDVIEALATEFGQQAVTLYGEIPMAQRQAVVDRFQTDPTCQVFIGGIQAAGVGITLTAASHVVFAEMDWVPGNVTQAEDRAHRIGQRNMVLVDHLVFEGSLDARMATILVEKQEVLAAALDTVTEQAPVVAVAEREHGATESTNRAKIAGEAATMTPERIEAIHSGLQMLAAMDQDHARDLNGMGFSRIDVQIGHSLAGCWRLTAKQAALGAKLVNKYRRQLLKVTIPGPGR